MNHFMFNKTIQLTCAILVGLLVTACPTKNPSDNPVVVPAKLAVEGTLDFGNTATSKTIGVKNNGGETLSWTSSSDKAWLSLNPKEGAVDAGKSVTLTVAVDRTQLAVGENKAVLTVSAKKDGTDIEGSPAKIEAKAIRVVAVPPQLTFSRADIKNITNTTATATGNLTKLGTEPITQHGHVWRLTAKPTITDSKTSLGQKTAVGEFSSNLTSLSPGKTYYIRAYLQTASDTVYSSEFNFATMGNLNLDQTSIAENSPGGTTVGTFSTVGSSSGLTYTLIAGEGSTDNGRFEIDGNSLKTASATRLNFEGGQKTYNIRVRSSGGAQPYERAFIINITDANDTPTGIALTDTTIAENNAKDAVIGTLSTTDEDAGDSHTYTLVVGDSDFKISGTSLRASKAFDFETKNSYGIRIETSDGKGGKFEKAFTIRISDVNEAPTAIALTSTSIGENNSVNDTIGLLSTTDDAGDRHTYTLMAGDSNFNISGTSLRASKTFDFEARNSYNIRIRTDDGKGGTFEKAFTITITGGDGKSTMMYNGKTYKTVKIGEQWWLAENLNDSSHTSGSSSCYDNQSSNCVTYGRLYDWAAAVSIGGKVPGWHLPTDEEWKTLEKALGMSASDADKIGVRRSGDVGAKLLQGASSGFEALPAGLRRPSGRFTDSSLSTFFYSASSEGSDKAWYRGITKGFPTINRDTNDRAFQLSVRLVKD